ncbi:hypothetical protein BDV18DRAFT_42964 [Aspergillus unguis]
MHPWRLQHYLAYLAQSASSPSRTAPARSLGLLCCGISVIHCHCHCRLDIHVLASLLRICWVWFEPYISSTLCLLYELAGQSILFDP